MTLFRSLGAAVLAIALARGSAAQEAVADRVLVQANRFPSAESSAPFAAVALDEETIRTAPQLRVDDILRAQIPGFSLFRRNGSRAANPTTQGVTLRNFGPNGAGRTLVLLDGIPLNDPFAGYVLWSQVPAASLGSVLIIPGGGAGLFGNAALAGTVFLVSNPIAGNGGAAEVSLGNENTYDASVSGTLVQGPVAASVFAERFATSGYPVLAAGQRGPVDNNASSDSDLIDLRAEWQIDRDSSLRLMARRFEETRGNGTALTQNDTTGLDFSAAWTTKFPAHDAELQISGYGQHRKFRSSFSSVNATREVETPALDQFNVPADAAGGSVVWTWAGAGGHRVTLGQDFRWVGGETNEAFLWDGARFVRERSAGGEQFFAGIFAEDAWALSDRLTIVGGLRFDRWQLFDGFRRESVRATGSSLSDLHYPDRSGNELNGRLGLRWEATDRLALRAAAYSGFRVPTLNELYRPFRVGSDVTEANAELNPEHLLGGEIGADWQVASNFRLSTTGFYNRLEDAVGNVTIGQGPGTFTPGGFIPAGGVLRQRQNIDLVLAPGFEAKAAWQLHPAVALSASYLFTRPAIERAANPVLEGKRLAQAPAHVLTGAVDWTPASRWILIAQAHYTGEQFDDDQNSRVLAAFATVDLGLTYDFSTHASVAVRVENLFDQQIETGKTADGLLSIGAARLVTLRMRWQF
ncbi:MAG: TonB-dependent receptor [Verrucomicrobiota bacterium]|nr:TonB-dependent receptor [Verrucomicrobiota bacterium]